MHKQVMQFLSSVKEQYPALFRGTRVLECGSLNINGTPRVFFEEPAEYVGLDWRPGPGVDVVSLAHEYYGHPDDHFDVVISTEMLEHDPHWMHSIHRMTQLVKPGGALIITCAGPGRAEHETYTSPESGYYRVISAMELYGFAVLHFDHVRVESRQSWSEDTYLCAYRKLSRGVTDQKATDTST
jgi:SAM-dependent methyltransferase